MLLKRISQLLPPDLACILPALDEAGIKTTEKLSFTPLATLYALAPSIPRAQIDQLVYFTLELAAPESRSGAEVLAECEKEGSQGRWEGFGVAGLDGVVEEWGGVGVVEICGARRTGKSLLALHATLRRLAADEAETAHWIDTEGSFNAARAQAILESWGIEETSPILDRLKVTNCFTLDPDLFDIIAAIRNEEEGGSSRTSVIVVDTVAAIFKDTLMSTTSQGHAAMITLMEMLSELTHSRGLLTIITNTTASSIPVNPLSAFSTTATKPSLGTAFTFCADLTLLLQETGKVFGLIDAEERERVLKRPGLRAVVEVLKSRVSPAGRWAVVETDGTRLFDVIPPPIHDERTVRLSAGEAVGPARPVHGPLRETMVP